MNDPLAITEAPVPTTQAAASVDLRAAYADALVRCGKLQTRCTESAASAERAERKLLGELLAVADALEAVVAMPAGGRQEAVAATLKLLRRVLSRRGVERIEVVGAVADPDLVDIDDSEADGTQPEETVLRELVAAYRRGDTVLRRGVVVASYLPHSSS